jgi:hypothetical protein
MFLSYVHDENHGNVYVNLKVKGQDGGFVHFKMKKETALKKLMKAYCLNEGVSRKLLAPDAFAAALAAIPAEDWCRTWAVDKTIMLQMTSKTVKEVVDKMRPPAFVRLSRSFWNCRAVP